MLLLSRNILKFKVACSNSTFAFRTHRPKGRSFLDTSIKWHHFSGLSDYEMVGAYEGGYYRSSGVWRPQQNCIMKSLNTGTGFCNVCREAIVKITCSVTDQTFLFNDFLQKNNPSDMSIKSIDVKALTTLKMIPNDMVKH